MALVLEWLRTGQLQLPLPGSGQTAQRWHQLARLAQIDVVAGRLAEAHTDAVAILSELGARHQAAMICGGSGPPRLPTRS